MFIYIRSIVIIALLSLNSACGTDDYNSGSDLQNPNLSVEPEYPPSNELELRYLALGDSYTIGQGVNVLDRWPNQLSNLLSLEGFDVQDTKIIAQTGWKTDQLLEAIEAENPINFNLVSLLIGVNNQYNNQSLEVFMPQFDDVLEKAIDLSGPKKHLFVVSIPDYGVTPFGSSNAEEIGLEIDLYNAYIESRCIALNVPFVNITELSRALGDAEGALASDNLHPSGEQYSQWVDKIFPVVIQMLSD